MEQTAGQQTADIIIGNGTILTMDTNEGKIANGALAIVGKNIIAVGTEKEIATGYTSKLWIDAHGGIIMPGLVNAHTHIAMSCFRGVADDMELQTWLDEHIFPLEAKFVTPELVYYGSLLGALEMIKSGTTTFCDMYFFEDETARAAKTIGIRCLLGEGLLDFPTPNAKNTAEGFAYNRMLLEKWREDSLVRICLEPHALYTCSPQLLIAAKTLADEFGVPLGMHLLENDGEIAILQERLQERATSFLARLGLLDERFFAFHGVRMDEQDRELFAQRGAKVIHNPQSNMKLASGMAPCVDMLKKGVCVGLGTDGAASNNNLNMFAEMSCAARLGKIREKNAAALPAAQVVHMATREGARALSWENEIGSLEVGKRADVIIIDTNQPHWTPLYNEYSHLVYAAAGADVDTVIIDGHLVMHKREVLTVDEREIIAKVNEIATRIKGS